MSGRILIVDDDATMSQTLESALSHKGFKATAVTSGEVGLERLGAEPFDAGVADLRMPGMGGIPLCQRITEGQPNVPVIVMTAFGSLETAIAAIRAGAYDYVMKPFEIDALVLILERALQHRALREEVRRLRLAASKDVPAEDLLGESPVMVRVRTLLGRVADTGATVLIAGESGTGKEVAARALHRRSSRREGPFLAIDCAAMPESLLESELFGHARGAFTDARTDRIGLLVGANGGTLFLDEVGEMPLAVQPKLLRALQERTVRPVGGDAEIPFDARIVAATNRDLETDVEEGRFRRDLFYRLNVIAIDLPPLRTRGNDILLLAQYFVQRLAARAGKRVIGLSAGAAEKMLAYPWPGNVRELQNCVERAVILTAYEQLTVEDLPKAVRRSIAAGPILEAVDPGSLVPLEELERRYVQRVLDIVGGNRSQAARILGLDRRTLYRKLNRYRGKGGEDSSSDTGDFGSHPATV